ncbi:hypothetical protein CAAN4_C09934 [[Candida] anglica]|uniref:Uncharacterized protein n=1 Tax=[Candida] anglica TaxID=148631 RepID=A0ABP0E9I7_9ASCO
MCSCIWEGTRGFQLMSQPKYPCRKNIHSKGVLEYGVTCVQKVCHLPPSLWYKYLNKTTNECYYRSHLYMLIHYTFDSTSTNFPRLNYAEIAYFNN